MAIGPFRRHVSVVISSVLFILLGAGFIVFEGSNALGGLYETAGTSDLSLAIETSVRDLASGSPVVLMVIVVVPILLVAALVARGVRRRAADPIPVELEE